jgi:hypothetical protein
VADCFEKLTVAFLVALAFTFVLKAFASLALSTGMDLMVVAILLNLPIFVKRSFYVQIYKYFVFLQKK